MKDTAALASIAAATYALQYNDVPSMSNVRPAKRDPWMGSGNGMGTRCNQTRKQRKEKRERRKNSR